MLGNIDADELIVYRSGGTMLNVYTLEEAGTNKATAVTWAMGERVEAVVKALATKGVKSSITTCPG